MKSRTSFTGNRPRYPVKPHSGQPTARTTGSMPWRSVSLFSSGVRLPRTGSAQVEQTRRMRRWAMAPRNVWAMVPKASPMSAIRPTALTASLAWTVASTR